MATGRLARELPPGLGRRSPWEPGQDWMLPVTVKAVRSPARETLSR
jgi:hypothetical protein